VCTYIYIYSGKIGGTKKDADVLIADSYVHTKQEGRHIIEPGSLYSYVNIMYVLLLFTERSGWTAPATHAVTSLNGMPHIDRPAQRSNWI
jgi:hypothetical protein